MFGGHRLYLARRYRRQIHGRPKDPNRPRPARLPTVTVQLPLYNERYVAERVVWAAAALDYPKDRLEIQVLDDSTDDTTARVARAVSRRSIIVIDGGSWLSKV